MRRPGVRFSCWPSRLFLACLVAALGLGVVMAESDKESESAKATDDKAGDGKKGDDDAAETFVFTNDDLLRMYGKPAEQPVAPKTADEPNQPKPGAPANPLDQMKEQNAADAEKRQRILDAEKELKDSRLRLAKLEKQLLAVRNPYAARPELSDEEKEARRAANEGAQERYLRTKLLVEKARQEVQNAEQKLAGARTGN